MLSLSETIRYLIFFVDNMQKEYSFSIMKTNEQSLKSDFCFILYLCL